MQGNLTFRGGLECLSRGGVSEAAAVALTSLLSDFFFFFFLATWLLESKFSLGEVGEEDAETGEEGERSTLESTWRCSGGGTDGTVAGTFGTTEVEKTKQVTQ